MSQLTQILQNQTNIINWINEVIANQKKIQDFVEATEADPDGYIRFTSGDITKKLKLSNILTPYVGAKTIYLGAIDVSISDYINNNSSPDWDLQENSIYIFEALIDGLMRSYLYTGAKKFLGNNQPDGDVLPTDFDLKNVRQLFIDGSFVKKGAGNLSLTTLEIGDIVFLKDVIDENDEDATITLSYHQYIGPDSELYESYIKLKTIE